MMRDDVTEIRTMHKRTSTEEEKEGAR